jgi:hypothetical protein
MVRFAMVLVLMTLLALPALAQTAPPPFSVHESTVRSYLGRDGKASQVLHLAMYGKTPGLMYQEDELYISVSNGKTAWNYQKTRNRLRTVPVTAPYKNNYIIDNIIAADRKFYRDVEVTDTGTAVEIAYKTRDAKPCLVKKRYTLQVGNTRMITALSLDLYAPDGTYVCQHVDSTYDYTPITDESMFNRQPPKDAERETPAK